MKFFNISIFSVIISIVASCSSSVGNYICCEANSIDYCCCQSGRQVVILNCEKSHQRYRRYTVVTCDTYREKKVKMEKDELNCHGCTNGYKCQEWIVKLFQALIDSSIN